ncbi:phage holin family protein [Baaleninema simplex]|uniref:phage holin family protein n=1 Tax=Baaleninema simplex TaxID=2862350 RepID=UPI00034D8DA3
MQIDIVGLIVTWLIMSLSFFIISKLPLGVEIDSLNKVLVSAAVFGILNALIKPVLLVLGFPFVVLTLGLFIVIINAIVFGLAAWFVTGFRLRWGIWSALLGSIALSIINSILFKVFPS